MAPKKDAHDGESNALLVGFTDKETKLLAAAFVSYIGSDKVRNYTAVPTMGMCSMSVIVICCCFNHTFSHSN